MEAVEFLQCYYKMCKSYVSSCVGCEAQGIDCELTTGTPELLVAIVEKWAKEHHVKPEQERHEPEHPEESNDLHAIIDEIEDRIYKLADRIAALEEYQVESMNEQKRTNKDVLLKVFPDARMDNNGIPYACPNRLDAHYNCDKFENCLRCRHTHWLAEVEE